MIARLTGTLIEVAADHAIVDVAGVGYLVQASARTLDALGGTGSNVILLTELQVREDGWTLVSRRKVSRSPGLPNANSVQGVGGRVALAILSVLTPEELSGAVSRGDKAMVGRANGVGPKLAMRIVNELAGKIGSPAVAGAAGAPAPRGGAAQDALSALANLGFKPAEASAAVAAAAEELGPDATLDALVRLALRKAAK